MLKPHPFPKGAVPRVDLLDPHTEPSDDALAALMRAFRSAVRAKSEALSAQARQRIEAAAALGAERAAARRAAFAKADPEPENF